MAETSTKPYLIRALYEWCCDNGFTPYLAVAVDGTTRVPRQHVKAGEIVLNVSPMATNRLQLGNDLIEFQARFSGVAHEISIPIANVSAIYARETGHGMAFEVAKAPAELDHGDGTDAATEPADGGGEPDGVVTDASDGSGGPADDQGREDVVPVRPATRPARRRGPRAVEAGDLAGAGEPAPSADVIAFGVPSGSRRRAAASAAAAAASGESTPAGSQPAGSQPADAQPPADRPPPDDDPSPSGGAPRARTRLTRVK